MKAWIVKEEVEGMMVALKCNFSGKSHCLRVPVITYFRYNKDEYHNLEFWSSVSSKCIDSYPANKNI